MVCRVNWCVLLAAPVHSVSDRIQETVKTVPTGLSDPIEIHFSSSPLTRSVVDGDFQMVLEMALE